MTFMNRILGLVLAAATVLNAQPAAPGLSNASLTGKYFAHQVIRLTSNGTAFTDQRSFSGVLQFDGQGGFTFTGTRKVGAGTADNFTSSGTYTVNPIGLVSLTSLQGAGALVNARYSTLALVGSSTDAGGGLYDLFVAIPAPTTFVLPGFFDGSYRVAGLEFDSAAPPVSRATFFTTNIGSLAISTPGLAGILSNGPAGVQQGNFPASPITIAIDGRGQALLPGASVTPLFFGTKTIYGSKDGNILLLAPEATGLHGLAIAIRAVSPASNTSFSGLYWSAGLRQNGVRPGSFAGTVNSVGNGVSLVARRARELEGVTDFTGRVDYSISSDGTGTNSTQRLALGAAGNVFVGSGASVADPNNFELYVGVRVPAVTTAAGPFLNPYGAVNTASFAPAAPVAPGQYMDLYGSALAAATVTSSAPFSTSLGGVQVLVNELPAPIYIVSAGLIKILIPQATPTGAATVVAVVNGTRSNAIPIIIARSAPGVFSATQNGIGPGAILRQTGSVMTVVNPARRGETIQVFLTGLGAVTPAPADGAAASLTTLSIANTNVRVYIRGVLSDVLFKGLAPGLVSLNQINVTIPASIPAGTWPLAIETDDGFTDQVDVIVAQ